MVDIGEFSFYGEANETRCFDLIPIDQQDTKNFDDLLFVIEFNHNNKKSIRKPFFCYILDKRYIHNVVEKYY